MQRGPGVRRTGVLILALVAALGACGGSDGATSASPGSTGAASSSTGASRSTGSTSAASAASAAVSSTSAGGGVVAPGVASAPVPVPVTKLVEFNGVIVKLPNGWSLAPSTSGGTACLQPSDASPAAPALPASLSPCALDIVDVGRFESRGIPVETLGPPRPTGWDHGTDAEACSVPEGGANPPPGVSSSGGRWYATWVSTLMSEGFDDLAERRASLGTWTVSCPLDPAQGFRPRVWWLPQSKVGFVQLRSGLDGGRDATVAAIARSADLSARSCTGVWSAAGSVVRGERASHLVYACKGQTVEVALTSLEDNAVFDLTDPSGAVIATESTGRTLSIAADGGYSFNVSGTRGNATYTLTVNRRGP